MGSIEVGGIEIGSSTSAGAPAGGALGGTFPNPTIPGMPMRFRVDGQGFTITTGVKGPVLVATCAGTITGWYIHGNASGSIVFDIWKKAFATGSIPTVANTITASAKPTLTATFAATSSTLTGWTTTFVAGDQFLINVDSVTTLVQAELCLLWTKT